MTALRQRKRLGRATSYTVRAAVSAILLSALMSRIEWPAFYEAIANASVTSLLFALGVFWLAVMLRSLSFALVVNRYRPVLKASDSVALTLVGTAASLIMPSGTGELVKANLACRIHGNPEHLVAGTIIDKLTSLPALAIVAIPAALIDGQFAIAGAAALIGILASLPLVRPSIVPWSLAIRLIAGKTASAPGRIADANRMHPVRLATVVAVSVAGWLVSFSAIYAVAWALGANIPLNQVVAAGAVMTLVSLVPISLAGLGLGQITLVAVLTSLGVDSQTAGQIAVVHLGLVLTPALAGIALLSTKTLSARAGDKASTSRKKRPLRVALVTTVFPRFAGDFTGRIVHELGKQLAARLVDVTVYAPHAPGLPTMEHVDAVPVRRFRYLPEKWERLCYMETGIPGALRHTPALWLTVPFFVLGMMHAARIAARDADILHAQWSPTGLLCSLAAPRARVALTMHGSDIALAHRSAFWRVVTLAALRRCEPLICVSESAADDVRALRGVPPLCLHVVNNGIDDSAFDSRQERPTGAGHVPHVLFVGRMTVEKGAADLLEALARPGVRPVRLTMVGDCDTDERVQQAKALGLAKRTTFTGRLTNDEVLDLMRGSDLMVIPSHAEGFSLVALEASAVGVPVVGTTVGIIPELVHPDALVEPGDVTELATRIETILSDSTLAEEVATHGRMQAKRFTWANTIQALISAYDHPCEHPPQADRIAARPCRDTAR